MDWSKIQESKYCEDYGRWKTKVEREQYWEDRKLSLAVKVQWARLRRGSVGKNTGGDTLMLPAEFVGERGKH